VQVLSFLLFPIVFSRVLPLSLHSLTTLFSPLTISGGSCYSQLSLARVYMLQATSLFPSCALPAHFSLHSSPLLCSRLPEPPSVLLHSILLSSPSQARPGLLGRTPIFMPSRDLPPTTGLLIATTLTQSFDSDFSHSHRQGLHKLSRLPCRDV